LKYINAGFYNKLIFHRVIKDFMVQGGGMLKGMLEKNAIESPIKLEISQNIKHSKYTISMARTQDPNSATSQFFICTADCAFLDGQYAAFGKVVEGEESVDSIEGMKTGTSGYHENVPTEDVLILSASVV